MDHPPQPKASFYNYRLFVLVPAALFLLCLGILVNNFLNTGEFVSRGLELKGGTVVSLSIPAQIDINSLQQHLSAKFPSAAVREARGLSGYEVSIEAAAETDTNKLLEEVRSQGIPTEKHSIRSVGAALGASFFQQVQLGLIVSFALMSLVVFVMFRAYSSSIAVILSAVFDIIETLAIMQLLGMKLTLASFAGLLMIIGYAVDAEILLNSRIIKTGSAIPIPQRVSGAIKTGMTMTLTAMVALAVLLVSNLSSILSEIAAVILIGLSVDMLNTWVQNVAIIRRHAEKKGL